MPLRFATRRRSLSPPPSPRTRSSDANHVSSEAVPQTRHLPACRERSQGCACAVCPHPRRTLPPGAPRVSDPLKDMVITCPNKLCSAPPIGTSLRGPRRAIDTTCSPMRRGIHSPRASMDRSARRFCPGDGRLMDGRSRVLDRQCRDRRAIAVRENRVRPPPRLRSRVRCTGRRRQMRDPLHHRTPTFGAQRQNIGRAKSRSRPRDDSLIPRRTSQCRKPLRDMRAISRQIMATVRIALGT